MVGRPAQPNSGGNIREAGLGQTQDHVSPSGPRVTRHPRISYPSVTSLLSSLSPSLCLSLSNHCLGVKPLAHTLAPRHTSSGLSGLFGLAQECMGSVLLFSPLSCLSGCGLQSGQMVFEDGGLLGASLSVCITVSLSIQLYCIPAEGVTSKSAAAEVFYVMDRVCCCASVIPCVPRQCCVVCVCVW